MENGTSILFGLPGVAGDRVERDADGVRTVHLRTEDETARACPECWVLSTTVRQRRTTRPSDLPYGEAPLQVRWPYSQHSASRRAGSPEPQFACRETLCRRKAFAEAIDGLPPYVRIRPSSAGSAVAIGV